MALGALGGAAMALAAPVRANSQQHTVVRLGAQPDDDITPILFGIKTGIFTKLGLDVQVGSSTGGSAIAAAVAGGSIDIGHANLVALLTAHLRGLPFTIVAGSGTYVAEHPDAALVVAKDSPVKSAAELNGKTASMPGLRDIFQIGIMAWMDQSGGDSATLKFLEIPNVVVPVALQQGRTDTAMLINPSLVSALDTGKVRILAHSFDAIAKRFLIAAWFCTNQYVTQNPDVIHRFVVGLRQAASYTNAHPADTVDMLSSYSQINVDLIKRMQRSITALTLDPIEIQPVIDLAAKYKIIERAFPATELIASPFVK